MLRRAKGCNEPIRPNAAVRTNRRSDARTAAAAAMVNGDALFQFFADSVDSGFQFMARSDVLVGRV